MLTSPPPSDRKAQLILDGWPVVILRLQTGVTLADIEPVLEQYERDVYGRNQPFISMTDLRSISAVPDAAFRARMGEWSKAGDEAMKAHSKGNVTVFSSKLIRGAVTAIFWIYKPPIPQGVAGTWNEGVEWCLHTLEKSNIDISPMARLSLRKDPFEYSVPA